MISCEACHKHFAPQGDEKVCQNCKSNDNTTADDAISITDDLLDRIYSLRGAPPSSHAMIPLNSVITEQPRLGEGVSAEPVHETECCGLGDIECCCECGDIECCRSCGEMECCCDDCDSCDCDGCCGDDSDGCVLS